METLKVVLSSDVNVLLLLDAVLKARSKQTGL